jgi:hypothetical protein
VRETCLETGKASWARVITVVTCVLLSGGIARAQAPCAPGPVPPPVTLTSGEYYFRVDNRPTVLLGTNPFAPFEALYSPLLAGVGVNEKLVRLAVNSLKQFPTYAGEVDEAWATQWDSVLCEAQANGLHVLVTLDVWPNWNDAANPTKWESSIYNVLNLCPAASPSDLLEPGGPTEVAWLDWVEGVVSRLHGHTNILGWEVFSEFDNIFGATTLIGANEVPAFCPTTGTDLPPAVCLMEAAAVRIRAVDPGRPVTASVKRVFDWVSLSTSTMDFLQVHPYANFVPIDDGNLDQAIIDQVRLRRAEYGKPVFIGESGLDEEFPDPSALTLNPRGWVGINQAIWAGAVSGSMNARMLWYEDGHDGDGSDPVDLCTLILPQFAAEPVCTDGDDATILRLSEVYQGASAPVARFLAGVDYSGFEPLTLTVGANLMGATLGNTTDVLGWVRDVQSAHDVAAGDPYWPWRPLGGESLTVNLPGQSADWIVDFYDTITGDVVGSIDADQDADDAITFRLPAFQGSIAFQIHEVSPIDVVIDIRLVAAFNRSNPRGQGVFPVAILTTRTAAGEPLDFDARTVAPSTVRFGPGGTAAERNRFVDGDRDGDLDLLLYFRRNRTGLVCGDTVASLTGETFTGRSIEGSDSFRNVGRGCL